MAVFTALAIAGGLTAGLIAARKKNKAGKARALEALETSKLAQAPGPTGAGTPTPPDATALRSQAQGAAGIAAQKQRRKAQLGSMLTGGGTTAKPRPGIGGTAGYQPKSLLGS